MQGFTGRDFEITLSGTGKLVAVNSINVQIEDATQATSSGGRPDGWVSGQIAGGDCELVIKSRQLKMFTEAAKKAGSWEDMPTEDITFQAEKGGQKIQVEVFGCKFRIPNLELDRTDSEETTITIPFVITDPELLRINGTPMVSR